MQKVSDMTKRLFHYTTMEGLQGILQTQTLWATHYRYLNDETELVLIKDKLIEYISPIVREEYEKIVEVNKDAIEAIDQEGGLDHVVLHDAESIVSASYSATGDGIYIVSFCGEHDDNYINENGLLSQWRGYGPDGGMALVFDTEKLEEILFIEADRYLNYTGHIADVIYSDDEAKFKAELSDNLDDLASYVKDMMLHMQLDEPDPPDATKAFPSFFQCISRYKHQGFKEENEIRIGCLLTSRYGEYLKLAEKEGSTIKPEKEKKFRTMNGEQIPYIELFNSPDITLPIKKIIVGPHKEKESRASDLSAMLRKTDIEIAVSDIPFAG